MSKIKKYIEKKIKDEIDSLLDEFDFDKYLNIEEIRKYADREIDSQIRTYVAYKVGSEMVKKITDKYPMLDHWIADKVERIINDIKSK